MKLKEIETPMDDQPIKIQMSNTDMDWKGNG